VAARAQSDTPWDRRTLAGLAAVSVMVEDINPEVAALGLHKVVVQTDVELRLRAAGIRVVNIAEASAASGYPVLFIDVRAYVPTTPAGSPPLLEQLVFAYVNVQFLQRVSLLRDPAIRANSATWKGRGFLGYVGRSGAVMALRQDVLDEVDQFINAWLSVNPR
jgi:hypothetical protein